MKILFLKKQTKEYLYAAICETVRRLWIEIKKGKTIDFETDVKLFMLPNDIWKKLCDVLKIEP